MKTIDWNTASKLGLIERINSEILHPLGLAMTRTPDNGFSQDILVADDMVFYYSPDIELKPVLTKKQIHEEITKLKGR